VHEAAQAALLSGFHLSFLSCAALTLIGLLAGIWMRDLPLQSSGRPAR
jgi:hypothetical protein